MEMELRILLIEDVPTDAELEIRELKRAGLRVVHRVVDTEAAYREALREFRPDVILSDFSMPHFDGMLALALARELVPDVPFIFVSGTIGEEYAIRALKNGATDYVLKNNLVRLPAAVERALRDAEELALRRKMEEAQARLVAILEATTDLVGIADKQGHPIYLNASGRRMLGVGAGEDLAATVLSEYHVLAERERISTMALPAAIRDGVWAGESTFLARDGREVPVSQVVIAHNDADGNLQYLSTIARDVTEQKRTEEALREAGLRYRSVFENVVEGIFLVDAEGRVVAGNPALARMLGYASFEDMAASVRKVSLDVYVEPGGRGHFRSVLEANGAVARFETRWRRKDGSIIWVSLSARMVTGLMGGRIHHIGVAEDITARKHAEEKIRRLNRIYAVLSGINTAIMRIRDRPELFREACRIAVEHGGFTFAWIGMLDADTRKVNPVAKAGRDEGYLAQINLSADPAAVGNCELTVLALTDAAPVVCGDIAADERMKTWRAEALKRGYRSVALLPLVVERRPVGLFVIYAPEPGVFDEEEMKLLVEMAGDIAFALDHIEKEERLNYLAYYDTVTGLANRALFQDRLDQRAINARRDGSAFSVVMLDLDRFRSVNESLGQAAGDDLLREVARRLKGALGDTDILARVGGNAFAVATRRADAASDTAHVPEQLASCIRERPFTVREKELRLDAKIGIALFPADGADAETLYRNAEAALKEAKRTGLPYRFYESRMNAMVGERLALEGKLRKALENDEFVLHYQPKVSLATGRIVGVEALIRWRDPEAGLVPPGKFISVLEETGMILEAGRWAIKRALTDLGKWRGAGTGPVRVSVNISPVQLRYEGFVSDVERAIADANSEAASLELEITESLVMEDIETNIGKLRTVRELGATVAIDDFGTGYSSLSYIVRLPVNALKIDRAFIKNMTSSADDTNIVSTIISLAHSMKLAVVAEGVETGDQAKLLRLLRCDEIQGYLFSPAVPAEQMERMLREDKSLPA